MPAKLAGITGIQPPVVKNLHHLLKRTFFRIRWHYPPFKSKKQEETYEITSKRVRLQKHLTHIPDLQRFILIQ
jgi:hypothetical protein